MKHISILPLYDATLTSIDSAHQIFSRVNDFMNYQGKPDFYKIEIVGCAKDTRLNSGLYAVFADKTIDQIQKTDVIVIPLLCGDFGEAISKNQEYVEWVCKQHRNRAEIICLCVGSFFLASTGLLDNKKCAVHWAAKNEFKTKFPNITVIDNTIITDEQGIYTCGGGFSYLNLILYIIEKHLGREISILASKMFEIDIERKSQNPFAIFIGQKKHGQETVLKAQAFIEANPTTAYSVDEICEMVAVSRRTFERHFKQCTGNSILEYIQRVKVEFVKKQLEAGKKTINEIIYEAGYTDIDAFRKVFKRFTDLSPIGYRKRFAGDS
ncbi:MULTISPECIES: GlxA family transcriptional regulator [Pedobacter]|uniref:Helix-turn-helix-domain containing protein AraC type n=1 Tax=Pedobacter heparinus (strain ATCC 13125 / DSM 2366 / CIP 104194 / JCM 7457 / NBRC 12017 / NCIMB 9290 / NRRL B-14731 / HIM 762-3) TaxID=485917 RepID=C6XTR7_PEDHD|nr:MULTISPECIES: helix-turn-helix domain-containing protein [Pedobacter]ACU03703.1 helix-turn-helix- domain containing protein AraC type [Pedobacter heparinus DSM 2366]MBB5436783.1 transcriptional regulator GlxA family with amidase domain [Pedobacter sp. AK017]